MPYYEIVNDVNDWLFGLLTVRCDVCIVV